MKRKICCILLLLTLSLSLFGCSSYTYENAVAYTAAPEALSLSETVENLDIDWVAGKISVSVWDGETIEVSETCAKKLEEDEVLHYYIHRGTLYIRFMAQSYLGATSVPKDLTIRLPQTLALSQFSADTVSADVELDGITVTNVAVETVSGDLDTTFTSDVRMLDFDTVSGDGTLTVTSLNHFEFDVTSGDILLIAETAPGDGQFDSVSGDFTLRVPEGSDFTVEYNTTSGVATHDIALTTNGDFYYSGAGTARYKVNTVSGGLRMEKP